VNLQAYWSTTKPEQHEFKCNYLKPETELNETSVCKITPSGSSSLSKNKESEERGLSLVKPSKNTMIEPKTMKIPPTLRIL